METDEIMRYIEENFNPDCGYTLIHNILEYVEGESEKDRYDFLTKMLAGIGLSDREIKRFA